MKYQFLRNGTYLKILTYATHELMESCICRECMRATTVREEFGGGGGRLMRQKETKKTACSPECRGGQQCTENKKQGVSIMSDVILFSLLPPNEKNKNRTGRGFTQFAT